MRPILALLVLALLTSACDTTRPSDHVSEPVVEAYLIVGEAFAPVRLTRTDDLDGVYDAEALGIVGASVRVVELAIDGSPARTIDYRASGVTRGLYLPVSDERVRAAVRYRLEADLPDGSRLSAETVVPGELDLIEPERFETVYQSTDQFEIRVGPSTYPGRQEIYVLSLQPLDPDPANLTPFYLDALYGIGPDETWDPASLDVTKLEDILLASSPPINAASFERLPDQSIRIRLPWFSVAFFGPVRVQVNAIDDNINDFFRYQNAQLGGSTLSPGELPNIVDTVDGGRGVFGSMARQTVELTILRP